MASLPFGRQIFGLFFDQRIETVASLAGRAIEMPIRPGVSPRTLRRAVRDAYSLAAQSLRIK